MVDRFGLGRRGGPVAITPLLDAGIFLGGYYLSPEVNEVTMSLDRDPLEYKTLDSQWVKRCSGARPVSCSIKGYLDPETSLAVNQYQDDGLPRAFSLSESAPVGGTAAMFCQAHLASRVQTTRSGEIPQVAMTLQGHGAALAGVCLHFAKSIAVGTVLGSAVQVGAVASGQRLYIAAHILGDVGSNDLVVTIQTDDASGFSTPVDRLVLSPSGRGGSFSSVAGPITDTWMRVTTEVDLSAISGGIAVFVAVGL